MEWEERRRHPFQSNRLDQNQKRCSFLSTNDDMFILAWASKGFILKSKTEQD